MRRLIVFFALLSSFLGVFSQENVFFVYRNDGIINTFLKEEIDSIRYSQIDIDSIYHRDYVCQEIWTADSVFRIPLELVDSISFVKPETVYANGAVPMTSEMRKYVVKVDSLSITFAPNTPSRLLPHKGDNLVNTEGSDGMQEGFLGCVKNITNNRDGILVECEAIGLEDVFERYYGLTTINTGDNTRASGNDNLPWRADPDSISFNILTVFENQGISYQRDNSNIFFGASGSAKYDITLDTDHEMFGALIYDPNYGTTISFRYISNIITTQESRLNGSISFGLEKELKYFPLLYFPAIFSTFSLSFGIYLRGNLDIISDKIYQQHHRYVFYWEWNDKGNDVVNDESRMLKISEKQQGVNIISGKADVGVYGRFSFDFLKSIKIKNNRHFGLLSGGVRFEGGLSFENTVEIPRVTDKEDPLRSTELYETLLNNSPKISSYFGASSIDISYLGVAANLFSFRPFIYQELKTFPYVPKFTNTKISVDKTGNVYANMEVSESVMPTDVGFSLQNKDDSKKRINRYTLSGYEGPSSPTYTVFLDPPSAPYVLYPLVNFGGIEMIGTPKTLPYDISIHTVEIDSDPKYYAGSGVLNKINVYFDGDPETLKDCSSYGIYIAHDNDTTLHKVKPLEPNHQIMKTTLFLYINKEDYKIDQNNFYAEASGFKIGTYAVSSDGEINYMGEKDLRKFIYDKKPEIWLTDTQINYETRLGIDSEGQMHYAFDVEASGYITGAFWIEKYRLTYDYYNVYHKASDIGIKISFGSDDTTISTMESTVTYILVNGKELKSNTFSYIIGSGMVSLSN